MRKLVGRDDRGAVMVIAVFLAVFLVGLLYYVIGISETLLTREHLQDTSDGAALSGSIMHARSMNLLVLINIVMAALLAILVTIKLVEGLAIIGMVIAAALAWFTGGSSLAAIPPLKVAQSNMAAAYQQVQPPIFAALQALHTASDIVAQLAPLAADATVLADINENGQPRGTKGLAVGTRLTLPVSDDSFSTLCGQAGKFPVKLAADALGRLPAVPQILGALEGPMQGMTSSLSSWFCGDGASPPPSYKRTEERAYPRGQLAKACDDEHLDSSGDLTLGGGKISPACEKSQQFEDAAFPDKKTGSCAGSDCSANSPYEQKVALAREQCSPTNRPAPFFYLYQSRAGTVPYRWTGKLWVRLDPEYKTPAAREASRPPCGPKLVHPTVAEGYETTVRKTASVKDVAPVCSDEVAPEQPRRDAPAIGSVRTVRFTEVVQILGCKRREEVTVQVSNGKSGGSDANGKSPKKVVDEAALGDESFQIRSLVKGEASRSAVDQMVRLPLWNRAEPKDPLAPFRQLGKYAVAQSEYFYDGEEARDEWMWNMKWRARLRRFRMPQGAALSQLQTVCGSALGAVCGSLLNDIGRFGGLVTH